jgi:hypothetical protein
MTMNRFETIEELPLLQGQCNDRGKTAGTAAMCNNFQIIERQRSDTTVDWTADTPYWQGVVMTAVRKLGMEAALTDAARAEVERYLEHNHRRWNSGPGSVGVYGA